ncbi:MAG: MFS transporter [Nanoarchaeota archaeon]|nr:MFS transporter [Nanoarchaeota archaeon]
MSFWKNFFAGTNKKEVVAWALFDFANSSYSLIILSFLFPIYFKEVIISGPASDFYWGLTISISILLAGLAAPIIGAMADHERRRKRKFVFFSILAILGIASLYFTGKNTLLLASTLFIATNFCFELALILYDSFLTRVSTPKTIGRISGLGWGLGYVGGLAALLLANIFYHHSPYSTWYRLVFPMVALFFLTFALPAFIILKDKQPSTNKKSLLTLIKIGLQKVVTTIKDVKKHKKIGLFLISFYLITDALVTLTIFIPVYARTTLHVTLAQLTILYVIIHIIGFPATMFFGWLSDKQGAKKILLSTIIIWGIIVLLLILAQSITTLYIVAILTGLVIGSSQSVARSWLVKIIPAHKRTEFLGFNGFASKISATTGPFIFASITSLTGNQRYAMLALLPYFIIAFFIFSRIKE